MARHGTVGIQWPRLVQSSHTRQDSPTHPSGELRLNDEQDAAGGRPGRDISYAVHLSDLAGEALFFAGTPQYLRIESTVIRRPSGNYSVAAPDSRTVSYQVYSRLESSLTRQRPEDSDVRPLSIEERDVYLQLPRLDPRIRELAHSVSGTDPSAMIQARRMENYLRTHYGYTLELPPSGTRRSARLFPVSSQERALRIFCFRHGRDAARAEDPSRVVTGFQSGIYNPISGTQLIRTSDAHSWVEAWLPGRGWTTFDPTPPDPNPPLMSIWTRLGFYADAAEVFWQDWVLNYDLDHQLQLAARMGRSGRQMGTSWWDNLGISAGRWWRSLVQFAERYGFILLGLAMLAVMGQLFGRDGSRWWKTRRRVQKVQRGEAQASDATLPYHRMLKVLHRRGIEKPVWLTPCEFARVVQEPGFPCWSRISPTPIISCALAAILKRRCK